MNLYTLPILILDAIYGYIKEQLAGVFFNRDSKRKAWPLPQFHFGYVALQKSLFKESEERPYVPVKNAMKEFVELWTHQIKCEDNVDMI